MGRVRNQGEVVLAIGTGDCNGTEGGPTVTSNGRSDSGVSFGILGEDGSRSHGGSGHANENVKTFVEEVS